MANDPVDEIVAAWVKADPERLEAARETWQIDDEHESFNEFLFQEIMDDNDGLTALVAAILEHALSPAEVGRILFDE